MRPNGIITLTTDFGLTDSYVGSMKGVIMGIAPDARLVDITHAIGPQDTNQAAHILKTFYQYFPAGTIHLVIVDPGVGSERRAIAFQTPEAIFIAPDNGILTEVWSDARARWGPEGCTVVELAERRYRRDRVSNTFHGRDIFAPIAAWLAKGVDSAKFGEEITDFVRFNPPKPKSVNGNTLRGVILKVDRFGNLVTNITPQDAPMLFASEPAPFKLVVGQQEITEILPNYSEGSPGQVFGILGSMGYLEIASNRGSAAKIIGSGKGSEVMISLEGAAAAGNGN
jgi:S-adenosyl-L-methionine hydrolase (adenosine-forming)